MQWRLGIATLIFFLTLVTALRRAEKPHAARLAIHWSSERDTRKSSHRFRSETSMQNHRQGVHTGFTRGRQLPRQIGFTFRCSVRDCACWGTTHFGTVATAKTQSMCVQSARGGRQTNESMHAERESMHELKRAELKARATVRVKVSSESVECAARHFGTNPVVAQTSHV